METQVLRQDYKDAWKRARELVGPLDTDYSTQIFLEDSTKQDNDWSVSAGDQPQFEHDEAKQDEESYQGEDALKASGTAETSVMEIETDLTHDDDQSPIAFPSGGNFFEPQPGSGDVHESEPIDVDKNGITNDDSSYTDSCSYEGSVDQVGGSKGGVDIQLLADLLEKGKATTCAIDKTSDVVLVIGATGVGKSTFVQAISGRKMASSWQENVGSSFVVEDARGELDGFEIGHGFSSQTRHVKSYFHEESSTFYVDSSGFGDTKAIETDIATSICIKEVARRAGRIRFAVLVNAHQFFCDRAGELRRSLELIANIIGHNFAEHKGCFTFLFTHCNNAIHLADRGCNDLAAKREQLAVMLSDAKKTAPDKVQRRLLASLRDSLRGDLSLCNVFDPVLSDMEAVRSILEPATATTSMEQPEQHIKCSLTVHSFMRIETEIKACKNRIADKLESGDLDQGIREDVAAIRALSACNDCIGEEWMEGILTLLSRGLSMLKDRIYEVVRSATVPAHCGSFTADEAKRVVSSIHNLHFLRNLLQECKGDGSGAADEERPEQALLEQLLNQKMDWMKEEVAGLSLFLLGNRPERPSLRAVVAVLKQLEVWAGVMHGDIAKTLEETKATISSNLLSLAQQEDQILPASAQGRCQRIRRAVVLKEILKADLAVFGPAIQDGLFVEAFSSAVDRAKAIVNSCAASVHRVLVDAFHSASTCSENINGRSLQINMLLQNEVAAVLEIGEIIKAGNIRRELGSGDPCTACSRVIDASFEERKELCAALMRELKDSEAGTIRLCLESLQVVANSLVEDRYRVAMETLKNNLRSRLVHAAEQVALCASEPASALGTVELQRNSMRLLRSFAWVEGQESAGEKPVLARSVAAAIDAYSCYGKNLLERAHKSAAGALGEEDAVAARQDLMFVAESVDSANRLCLIDSEIEEALKPAVSSLVGVLVGWCEREASTALPDSFLQLDVNQTNRNILVSKVIKTMLVPGSERLLSRFLAGVHKQADSYRECFRQQLEAPLDFDGIAAVLNKTSELEACPDLASMLPSIEELRQGVLASVQGVARGINEQIMDLSRDSDFGALEKQLQELEHGNGVLSKHFKHSVVVLEPLQRAFEMRKLEIDSHFLGLIEDKDFRAVRSYLADQKEEQQDRRYRLCLTLLSAKLWSEVEQIRLFMDNPSSHAAGVVRDRLDTLAKAKAGLAGLVDCFPPPSQDKVGWKVDDVLQGLKRDILGELDSWLRKTSHYVEDLDFLAADVGTKRCQALSEVYGRCKRVVALEDSVVGLESAVKQTIEKFLVDLLHQPDSEQRQPWKFDPPTKKLYRCLSNLKESVSKAGCPPHIVNLYEGAKNSLALGLNKVPATLENEWLSGQFSRSLTILDFLRKELQYGGLMDHVNVAFDIDELLKEVSSHKVEQQRKLQSIILDMPGIDQIAQQLERQKKKPWSFLRWGGKGDYEETCAMAANKVLDLISETTMRLHKLQFQGLRSRLILLDHVTSKLWEHIKGTVQRRPVAVLESEMDNVYHVLFKDIEGSFSRRSIGHLSETLFVAFRELVAELHNNHSAGKHVSGKLEAACDEFRRRVHITLLAQCKIALKRFDTAADELDFERVLWLGEDVQDLGHFFITQFNLYHQECCSTPEWGDADELMSLVRERFAGGGEVLNIGRSFAMLGLRSNATIADVKKSYRKMSRLQHPDKNPGDMEAPKRFMQLKEASDLLENANNLALLHNHDFPFLSKAIRKIPGYLSEMICQHLDGSEYGLVLGLLHKLDSYDGMASLLHTNQTGSFATGATVRARMYTHIRQHGNGLLVDIKNAQKRRKFVQLHHTFADLTKFEICFKPYKEIIESSLTSQMLSELEDNLDLIHTQTSALLGRTENQANQGIDNFARKMVELGLYLDGFPPLKKKASDCLHSVLDGIQHEHWGASFTFMLGLLLEGGKFSDDDDDKRVGKVIVDSFRHFADVRTLVFNREAATIDLSDCVKQTRTHNCDATTGALQDAPFDRDLLANEYTRYSGLFDTFFKEFVQDGHDGLVEKVFTMVHEIGPCGVASWSKQTKKKVPEVLAGVFATFTIIKSGKSFLRMRQEIGNSAVYQDRDRLLFRPHKIQVIAILRLLGVGSEQERLQSHIMEVLTGQGKSIALGTMAVVLAVLGFQVRCVSYSENLSDRDRDLFEDIFRAFKVEDRIKYSTIDEMSEDEIAKTGDVRRLSASLIKSQLASRETLVSARAKSNKGVGALRKGPLPLNGEEILEVDEVDVFFGPNFYGQTINPITHIHHPHVETLTRKVWASRRESLSFALVSKWTEYTIVQDRFSSCRLLIEAEVKSMIQGVQTFDRSKYEVDPINLRIGYQELDSVSWCTHHGYRTAFACLHELESGAFRHVQGPKADKLMQQAFSLQINCGQFSYTNIAPSAIVGVSGTVAALSTEERLIMSDFGMDTYTFVPSVYSPSNLTDDQAGRGIIIESERSRQLQTVATEMKQAIDRGRSVIVFFKDDERLVEFSQSKHWKQFKNGNVLSGTTEKETRKYIINKAATSKQATISEAVFGRGTDFFSKDQKLDDAGGMHVIQTFLSVEKTEEVQIRGRTARQGKNGSYGMVLLDGDLVADFGIASGSWSAVPRKQLYDFLDGHRQKTHAKQLSETKQKIKEAAKIDQVSRDYLDALVRGDTNEARRLLERIYKVQS